GTTRQAPGRRGYSLPACGRTRLLWRAGWARRPVAARARCAIPELPEVETVRRQLEPWLTGRTVARAELLAPPGPKYAGLERAAGQTIEAVGRRGKFLLMPLSQGDELVAHLGMTGVLTPGGASEPAKHLRVAVDLEGRTPNRLEFTDTRRFGRFLIVRRGDYSNLPTLAALGPEPFDDAFTPELFHRALGRSTM